MRKTMVAGFMGVMMAVAAGLEMAEVAGSRTLGVPSPEIITLTHGWSAKKQILDKAVYNDTNEKVGEVEDILVAPNKSVSCAILSVGGFLGLGERYVAIPFSQFTGGTEKFVLPGATKETVQALPEFVYAK